LEASASGLRWPVPPDRLVAFALTAAALIAVPGPSVLFAVGRALSHGRRLALASVAGNGGGVTVQVLAVAAGLGAVVQTSVLAYEIVRWTGVAYLAYLGAQAVRHRHELARGLAAGSLAVTARRCLRDGFVVGLANPKTGAFFAAILPQFVVPDAGLVPLQLAGLGLTAVAIALVVESGWVLAASAAGPRIARSPRTMGRLGGAGGGTMLAMSAHLALTGRRD
jgi:threonine/homoserine/homoserine lactone efflux protein